MDGDEGRRTGLDTGMEAGTDRQGQRGITDLLKSVVALPQLLLQVRWASLQLLLQLPQPPALQHIQELSPVPGQDPPVVMDRLQPATTPRHPAGDRPIPMPTCYG